MLKEDDSQAQIATAEDISKRSDYAFVHTNGGDGLRLATGTTLDGAMSTKEGVPSPSQTPAHGTGNRLP